MNEKRPATTRADGSPEREQMIRIDGRGQILDMLRAADAEFRELILRRLEKRDPQLARELRREL